jgi:hypothetical protein
MDGNRSKSQVEMSPLAEAAWTLISTGNPLQFKIMRGEEIAVEYFQATAQGPTD